MKIGIVGLGLIGGSLALDLRPLGHQILGVSRRTETCDQAIEQGFVDAASSELSLLADAELVFLCPPLSAMRSTVEHLIPYLKPETILTDVGSVKASIVQAIAPLWPNFVGGHPMAGTAESGLSAAQRHLFAGCPYVLTPLETTPTPALEAMASLVGQLQAKLYYADPEHHDRAVAWISHLPVMVSAALISASAHEPDSAILNLAHDLASSGFRDTSRVGGGNPELGVMMAEYNREAILDTLQTYRQHLDALADLIQQENWQALATQLQLTNAKRNQFVKN
jgi:arogenate dehydrogenase (NADP+)